MIAMGDESKDIMYIRNILEALGFYNQLGPTRLLVDSTAAIAIAVRTSSIPSIVGSRILSV